MRPGCPGVRARDTGTLFLIFMSSLIVGRLGYGALSIAGASHRGDQTDPLWIVLMTKA